MVRLDALYYDSALFERGFLFIAGSDEAGRGCLAGPVAAAAVMLPRNCDIPGLNDSKKLSAKRREALLPVILEKALAVRVCMTDACEIDKTNILRASLRAMGNALLDLPVKPEIVLIDGIFLPDIHIKDCEITAVPGGDARSMCIASASVVAKVTRDRLMLEYAKTYPEYGFDRHKGYPTKAHYAAIEQHGICPIHRKSFKLFRN